MNLAGPLILFTKMMLLSFLIMWVRFSVPRFREDQLQRFAWKVLIPLPWPTSSSRPSSRWRSDGVRQAEDARVC